MKIYLRVNNLVKEKKQTNKQKKKTEKTKLTNK